MNLAGNGLYVATHYYSVDLPSRFCDFSKLEPINTHLLLMKRDLMNLVDKLKPISSSDFTISASLNREERIQINEKSDWLLIPGTLLLHKQNQNCPSSSSFAQMHPL
jgi:hypothetical protein